MWILVVIFDATLAIHLLYLTGSLCHRRMSASPSDISGFNGHDLNHIPGSVPEPSTSTTLVLVRNQHLRRRHISAAVFDIASDSTYIYPIDIDVSELYEFLPRENSPRISKYQIKITRKEQKEQKTRVKRGHGIDCRARPVSGGGNRNSMGS